MWRGENRPARILSFPQGELLRSSGAEKNEKRILMLGDLAIRFDEKPISDRLLIHGVLHLLGYTHDKGKDYIQMRKKEKEVLAKLKILEKKS